MSSPITPVFPFQVSAQDSDYLSITTIDDLVRQNLTNLLLTSPGERMMDPEFGVGLRRYLFENRTSQLLATIRSVIVSQVKKYMPFLAIQQIQFLIDNNNPNSIGLQIVFQVIESEIDSTLNIIYNPATNRFSTI